MQRTEQELGVSPPEWTHDVLLDCQPPGALARAFVSHHLVAHRVFHLVDLARVVTAELIGNASAPVDVPLRLSMSKSAAVVTLRVEAGVEPSIADAVVLPDPVDTTCGSGVIGLTGLEWGVSEASGATRGLWATLDASRHRHAVESVRGVLHFMGEAAPAPQEEPPPVEAAGEPAPVPHAEQSAITAL